MGHYLCLTPFVPLSDQLHQASPKVHLVGEGEELKEGFHPLSLAHSPLGVEGNPP